MKNDLSSIPKAGRPSWSKLLQESVVFDRLSIAEIEEMKDWCFTFAGDECYIDSFKGMPITGDWAFIEYFGKYYFWIDNKQARTYFKLRFMK